MKTPLLVATMTLLVASLATLAWVAKTRGEVVRPAEIPEIGASAADRAATAAPGQRLLVIQAAPGTTPSGRIFQSARGAEGWMPYAATSVGGDPLIPSLEALAAAAAADFGPDRRFDLETVRALQVFGVAVVVVSDGGKATMPDVGERDPNVGTAPEVPALRLRHANPVLMLVAEGEGQKASDPVGFVRALRKGDAQFQDVDVESHRWGVGVTVDAATDGEYLFPCSAAGARVTVDGAPAVVRAATVPLLVVKLPAGVHRVEVVYGEPDNGRGGVAIAAAAGAVVSLIALWLGLRPHPAGSATESSAPPRAP